MAGYIRQDTTNNIADGNIINASDFDNEYNAIEAAFNASTGHTHDGTASEGAPITKVGPSQNIVVGTSTTLPKTNNTMDLGSATFKFKDVYAAGTAYIATLDLTNALAVADGGTGATTLTGYVKGSGTSAFTASSTIPVTDLTGTLPVANGGTGATTLTGYVKGSGTSAFSASSTIPVTDLSGTLSVAGGGTGATTLTGYVKGSGTSALTASSTVPGSDISGTVAVVNGGTGQTSYTNGQLLIGNTTGNTLTKATLTAGSNVSITNGTGSITIAATGDTVLANNNAFTGANTFYNSTGQTFGTATSTQDGIVLSGRAGGSSSYRVTLTPTTLTANRTLTLPDASTTVVGTDVTQTLTNKTITAEKETAVSLTGTAIDLSTGNYFYKTISANTTFTVSNVPSSGTAQAFVLELTNAGAYTITWFAGLEFPGGTAPVLTASGRDVLVFFTRDGGTEWSGFVVGKDVKGP